MCVHFIRTHLSKLYVHICDISYLANLPNSNFTNYAKTRLCAARIYASMQWRVLDSPLFGGGGVDVRCEHFLAKLCVKTKELGSVGGGGPGSATAMFRKCLLLVFIVSSRTTYCVRVELSETAKNSANLWPGQFTTYHHHHHYHRLVNFKCA